MELSASVLAKNLKNSAMGLMRFASGTSQAFATSKKIADRKWAHGPQCIKDQAEYIEPHYMKRAFCQHLNMWVDRELHTEVSQKELAQLHQYKQDFWRMAHFGLTVPVFGGYAALPLAWMLSDDTWCPSTFNQTPEEIKEWRRAVDMYRYRGASKHVYDCRWWLEFFNVVPQEYAEGFENLFERNDVRRDPLKVAAVADYYETRLPFRIFRRKQGRHLCNAMAIPTFPLWAKMCMQKRICDYWEIAWNEDYMVITQNLVPSMTDEELFDYAWRRFLAPVNKELTREQVEQRVNDYLAFINYKNRLVDEGRAPNLWVVTSYTLGYYNEPSYLTEDIAELDKNDYDHIKDIPQDAFLKRLEFENGPLRDQVEAHSHKLLEERRKKEAALAAE